MPHPFNPLNAPKMPGYFEHVRQDVIDMVRQSGLRARRVLELGCSSGVTGAALKQLVGAERYVGIEQSADAAAAARKLLDHVVEADLDVARPATSGLGEERFDLLVALDVLEHLKDPWEALYAWCQRLNPGGHAVLSIPNIQNIRIIADLADGHFKYLNEGVLDVTHLRFFTLEGIRELVHGAGLTNGQIHAEMNVDVDPDKGAATGNQFRFGRVQINDLTRDEVTALATLRYIVIAQRQG